MQCKLCLQDKPLTKESHIIPRQFFHNASDNIDKGFGSVKHGDKASRLYSKKSKSQQIQSGIYVSDILCRDCEQRLGVFDNYAQSILLAEKNIEKDDKANLWKVPNINYKKLKLFFISVLWRSHICNHSFFSAVNLTSNLETKLRDMIVEENPDSENNFSVFLLRYREVEAIKFAVYKWKQPCEMYMFRLGYYAVFIKVDENSWPYIFQKHMLKPEQDLLIPVQNYKKTKEYQSDIDNIDKYKP
ncbi:MAG TPA: hypothetical protein VF677_00015 [Flavobacterium sp.]|jgi:hypothetical protein